VEGGISGGIKTAASDLNPFSAGFGLLLNGTAPKIAKEAFGFNFAAAANQLETFFSTIRSTMKQLECSPNNPGTPGCVDPNSHPNYYHPMDAWGEFEATTEMIIGVLVRQSDLASLDLQ
jgi:hypothetical protein